MRKIIDGRSKKEVQTKLDRLLKLNEDWKQISDIKVDDSGVGYNYVRYVAVVETDDKHKEGSKRYWGIF